MFLFILLLFVFVLVLSIYYKLTFWSRQGIPNEVSSIWNRFTEPFHTADMKSSLKYGSVVGIYEGLNPVLMITDPILIRKVMIEDFWNFPNHRIFYHESQTAGKSIVNAEDFKWKRLRQIMSPVFSLGSLKSMKSSYDSCIKVLLDNLNQVTSDSANGMANVNIRDYFGSFSMDIICSICFGIRIDSFRDPNNEIVTKIKHFLGSSLSLKTFAAICMPSLMKWFDMYMLDYPTLVYLSKLTRSILDEKKVQVTKGATPRKDFIRSLMEAKDINGIDHLPDEEIADQIILFLVAGYDTTATLLSSIGYCLAGHPSVQEKLYQEVSAFFKSLEVEPFAQSSEEDAIRSQYYTKLFALKYLDAVVKETLRFLPTVPRAERRANKDCMLGDIWIPKDTLIIIPIYALNHDEKYFNNPRVFDPNRFLNASENDKLKMNQVYMPFATGPRVCIGQQFALLEVKSVLVHVIKSFEFKLNHSTEIPLVYQRGRPVSTPRTVNLTVARRDLKQLKN